MMSDLIRREDAIKEICKARTPDVVSHQYAELFINAVRRAPSAYRPQEWIPCSERVPRGSDGILECEMVLMTLSVGYVACGWINGDTAYVLINNPTYDQIVIADSKEVIAWMPLPKPWKGADDGRNAD